MAKNSVEGNRTRTARYRAALAGRGIRPVQLMAPEGAHALLRQAAGLMTREQDPLDPRAALRQAGSANKARDGAEMAHSPEPGGQGLAAGLEAARAAEAAARSGLADAEDRARALAAELEAARDASRRAEQAGAAEAAAALARAEVAERGREEAARELAAVRSEAEAAQGRERAAQEAADALRGELAGIKGRGGWRGVLLRLAGATRTRTIQMVLVPVLAGMVVGCAAVPSPPFDLTSKRPAKVLDMIEWLGSLQDLSQTAVVTGGLRLSPSPKINFAEQGGKRVPNSISFLDYVPLAGMQNSKVGYSMFAPQGPAALSRRSGDPESVIRANVDFVLNEDEVCLRKSDFVGRFGEPIRTFPITDDGGFSYFWLIGSEGKWKTYMYAPFRKNETDCTNIIGIWQKTGEDIRG